MAWVYDFVCSSLVPILAFNVGALCDKLFLKRDQKSTTLTVLGWVYNGLLFVLMNVAVNACRFLGSAITKKAKRYQWKTVFVLPDVHKFVKFGYSLWFLLVEIATGIFVGLLVEPSVAGVIALNSVVVYPLFGATCGWFGVLVFRQLPFSQKSHKYVIAANVLTYACLAITLWLLWHPQSVGSAVAAANAT